MIIDGGRGLQLVRIVVACKKTTKKWMESVGFHFHQYTSATGAAGSRQKPAGSRSSYFTYIHSSTHFACFCDNSFLTPLLSSYINPTYTLALHPFLGPLHPSTSPTHLTSHSSHYIPLLTKIKSNSTSFTYHISKIIWLDCFFRSHASSWQSNIVITPILHSWVK